MRSFVFVLFIFSSALYSQKNNSKNLKNPNYNCRKSSNLDFTQLAERFPINQSDKIALVAFNSKGGPQGLEGSVASMAQTVPQYGFPLPSDSLEFHLLKEWKFLNSKELSQLTNILYNYNFDPKKDSTIYGAFCYAPRNGIVFINEDNKIIEFLEICFECSGFETLTKTHAFGDFCEGKLDMLYHFFLENGIKYGIID